MASRNNSFSFLATIVIVIIIITVAYLNQWKYINTQRRVNRYSGEEQGRVVRDSGVGEWILIDELCEWIEETTLAAQWVKH